MIFEKVKDGKGRVLLNQFSTLNVIICPFWAQKTLQID